MSDARTIAVYDARADDYARMTEKLFEMRELEAFAAALPAGARVLDLGCGPGFYARWLAGQGFEVEAWDASAGMVARARTLGIEARQARFQDLEAEGVYDGIWANFSLLHVPRDNLPGILACIHRAGGPGMAFHIGMKLGQGEGPDTIGRFYTYYGEDELEEVLTAAGFTMLRRWHGKGPGLDGTEARHVTMLCHG